MVYSHCWRASTKKTQNDKSYIYLDVENRNNQPLFSFLIETPPFHHHHLLSVQFIVCSDLRILIVAI